MLEVSDPVTVSDSDVLTAVAVLEPSPFVLSILTSIDRTSLCREDAVTYLQILERVSAWLASLQAEVLVAAAGIEPQVDEFAVFDGRTVRVEDAVREEVAAALRWSPVTTQHGIDTARLLAGPLSATHEALSLGEITTGHVAVMVEATTRLPGRYADGGTHGADFTVACARCSPGSCRSRVAGRCRRPGPQRVGRCW